MSVDPNTGSDAEADSDGTSTLDSDVETDISTANTMRERADQSGVKLWVVLAANRLVVTGLLAAIVFGALLLAGTVFFPSFVSEIRGGDVITTTFSTMVSVIITGATLVVTISQLVISQENGPLGDQHQRMSASMNVREYVQELIDQQLPADPSAFLRVMVTRTEEQARTLRETVADHDEANDELRSEIDEFTESLIGNAEEVAEQLDGTSFGSFDVLFAALNYNYSWKVFQLERIEHQHGEDLSDETRTIIQELRTTLTMFGPVREHIKTMYFEWALIDLSKLIMYVSVPALIVAGGMMMFVGGSSFPGSTLGFPNLLLATVTAFTITTLPFLLLVSYITRIATVAKRTLAIGPLILRDSQR